MAEVRSYITGHCSQLAGMALKGAGWRTVRFPARAHLIAVKKRLWLFDTGYSRHLGTAAQGIFSLYAKVTPVHFEEHNALAGQLAREGIETAGLSGIIISHFHADHIAGLRDFPEPPLYCSAEAWSHVRGLSGFRALRQAFIPKLLPDDFEERLSHVDQFHEHMLPRELNPFTRGWELPDCDGEVFLVALPGHAKGQLGVFVHTASGWVLLAADAAWTPQNYRELRGPALPARLVIHDYTQFIHTLRLLHGLHAKGAATIVLCHERGEAQ